MTSSTLEQLPRWARDVVSGARVGHLGLLDDRDRPRVLPVTFVLRNDTLVSAVDYKPKRVAPGELARVRYLRRRPEATLTVDRYEEDWTQLAWVQALGGVDVVAAREAPEAIAALCAKYEQYRARAPGGPLLVLRPERFVWWRAAERSD